MCNCLLECLRPSVFALMQGCPWYGPRVAREKFIRPRREFNFGLPPKSSPKILNEKFRGKVASLTAYSHPRAVKDRFWSSFFSHRENPMFDQIAVLPSRFVGLGSHATSLCPIWSSFEKVWTPLH